MKTTFNRSLIGSLAVSLASLTLSFAADTKAPGTSWKSDLLAWRAQEAKDLQDQFGHGVPCERGVHGRHHGRILPN